MSIQKAVVRILTPPEEPEHSLSDHENLGTAFFTYGKNGELLLLTCWHVVEEYVGQGIKNIRFKRLGDEQEYQAYIYFPSWPKQRSAAEEQDVALLKISGNFPVDQVAVFPLASCRNAVSLDNDNIPEYEFETYGFPNPKKKKGSKQKTGGSDSKIKGYIERNGNTHFLKLREEIISKNSDFKFKEGYSGGPILHSRSGSVLAMLTAVFKNNSDHLVIEGAKGITSDDIYTLLGDYLPPLERSPDRIGLLTGARRFFSKLDYDPEKTFTLKVISKDFNALISIKDIFNFRYEDKEEEEDGKKKSSMHPMLSLGYWLAPNPRGNRWRHLVLINKGGCGKTTSLMELTEYLQKEKWKDRPIPIFIPLRDCRSSSGGYRSFLDYIQEKFRLEIPVNTLKNWMQEAGPQKHFPKALLILDGYDELPSEHISYFHREISEGLREWPDVQLILSCRPEFQPPFTQDSHSFIQLSLAGLKYSDFDYWLDNELSSLPKYHSQKIKQYLSIQDNEKGWSESEKIFREFLLSSPMILSVFLEVIRDTPLEKAETIENSWLQLNNTGIVLEQYIRQRLEKHKVTAGLDHNDHSELEPVLLEWFYHHFLPYLAFSFPSIDCLGIEIWIKGYSAFLKSIDLQYFLRSFPDQKTHIKRFSANKDRWQQLVSEKLQEKLEHSGLFDEDEFTYHFKHNQIRSYFFARHLCNELLLFGNSSQLPPSWQKKIYPEEICRLVMEILSVNEKKDHLYRLFDLLRGQASEAVKNILSNALATLDSVPGGHLAEANLSDLAVEDFDFSGRYLSKLSKACIFDSSNIGLSNFIPTGISKIRSIEVIENQGRRVLIVSGWQSTVTVNLVYDLHDGNRMLQWEKLLYGKEIKVQVEGKLVYVYDLRLGSWKCYSFDPGTGRLYLQEAGQFPPSPVWSDCYVSGKTVLIVHLREQVLQLIQKQRGNKQKKIQKFRLQDNNTDIVGKVVFFRFLYNYLFVGYEEGWIRVFIVEPREKPFAEQIFNLRIQKALQSDDSVYLSPEKDGFLWVQEDRFRAGLYFFADERRSQSLSWISKSRLPFVGFQADDEEVQIITTERAGYKNTHKADHEKLWRIRNFRLPDSLLSSFDKPDWFLHLEYHPDRQLISMDTDGKLKFWKAEANNWINTRELLLKGFNSRGGGDLQVAFFENNHKMLIACAPNWIQIWDLNQQCLLDCIQLKAVGEIGSIELMYFPGYDAHFLLIHDISSGGKAVVYNADDPKDLAKKEGLPTMRISKKERIAFGNNTNPYQWVYSNVLEHQVIVEELVPQKGTEHIQEKLVLSAGNGQFMIGKNFNIYCPTKERQSLIEYLPGRIGKGRQLPGDLFWGQKDCAPVSFNGGKNYFLLSAEGISVYASDFRIVRSIKFKYALFSFSQHLIAYGHPSKARILIGITHQGKEYQHLGKERERNFDGLEMKPGKYWGGSFYELDYQEDDELKMWTTFIGFADVLGLRSLYYLPNGDILIGHSLKPVYKLIQRGSDKAIMGISHFYVDPELRHIKGCSFQRVPDSPGEPGFHEILRQYGGVL